MVKYHRGNVKASVAFFEPKNVLFKNKSYFKQHFLQYFNNGKTSIHQPNSVNQLSFWNMGV